MAAMSLNVCSTANRMHGGVKVPRFNHCVATIQTTTAVGGSMRPSPPFTQMVRILCQILVLFLMGPWVRGSGLADAASPIPGLTQGVLNSLLDGVTRSPHPVASAGAGSSGSIRIQTRVITGDGSQATNYSLVVGTNQYVAPPLAQGGSSGFHLVMLSRQTLGLVSNASYGTNAQEIDLMINALETAAGENLLVLSTMGATAPMGPGIGILDGILASFPLGWTPNRLIDPWAERFASAYSFIGNRGLSFGQGIEFSSIENPQTTGQIDAVLIQDINGNFFPVLPTFVSIQTSAGPGQDTVLISTQSSTNAFPAPAFPPGTPGGFHMLVARRDTLHQVATNPAVVLLNQSYATGGTELTPSLNAMGQLVSDLGSLQGEIDGGEVVVILATVGAPFYPCNATTCPGFASLMFAEAFLEIVSRIQNQFGAVGDIEPLLSGGYYSLVGIPWAGGDAMPDSVEDRPWTPSGSNSTNLSVLLQMGREGWLEPVASDTMGGVDYRLYQIAYQPAVPWPVAPNATTAPCPPGDEFCEAYQWISTAAIGNPSTTLRQEYINVSANLSGYQTTVATMTYPSVAGLGFSTNAFEAVQSQLSIELGYAQDVQDFFRNLTGLVQDMAEDQTIGLLAAYAQVQAMVQAPATTSASYDAKAVLKFVTQLAGAVDPDPGTKAALGVATACLDFGLAQNRTTDGNSTDQFLAQVGQLSGQIQNMFANNLNGVGALMDEVNSDWGKMLALAPLTQSDTAGNGFWWNGTTSSDQLKAMTPAFKVSYYKALLPTLYQRVTFTNVTFNDPSGYTYKTDCNNEYGICDCHTPYSPPSYDYLAVGTDVQSTWNIHLIATSDRKYPASSVITVDLPAQGVYAPDFFRGVGSWTGIIPKVDPEGWSDYLNNNGFCSGLLRPAPRSDGGRRLAIGVEPGGRHQLEWSSTVRGPWIPAGDPVLAEDRILVLEPSVQGDDTVFFRVRHLE